MLCICICAYAHSHFVQRALKKTRTFFCKVECVGIVVQKILHYTPCESHTAHVYTSMSLEHEIEYESEIDDALLLQADEGVICSLGSADPPPPSPVLCDPGAGPVSHAGLATTIDGAKAFENSAKASGLARATRCPPQS